MTPNLIVAGCYGPGSGLADAVAGCLAPGLALNPLEGESHGGIGEVPGELRERAIRMAVEAWRDPATRPGTLARIGKQPGIYPEGLRSWVTQAEIEEGTRPGATTDDATRLAELEREVGELPSERHSEKRVGVLGINASMRRARRASLVYSLPRLRPVACPAMCGPAGFPPGRRAA